MKFLDEILSDEILLFFWNIENKIDSLRYTFVSIFIYINYKKMIVRYDYYSLENDEIFVNELAYDVDDIDNEEFEQMYDEMFRYIRHKALD